MTADSKEDLSRYYMYRTAVAMAWCDGALSAEEQTLIHDQLLNHATFSDGQREQLEQDIKDGVSFDDVYQQVSEKRDRARLINFARALFHSDGTFCEAEKIVLEKLETYHQSLTDSSSALKQARSATQSYHSAEQDRSTNIGQSSSGIISNAFRFLREV